MKRWGRPFAWLATALAVRSVMVFVLAAGLGMRSDYRGDFIGHTTSTANESDTWSISTETGQVRVHRMWERRPHVASTQNHQ